MPLGTAGNRAKAIASFISEWVLPQEAERYTFHALQEQRGLELNEYSFAAAINIAANAKDPEVAQQLVRMSRISLHVQRGAAGHSSARLAIPC